MSTRAVLPISLLAGWFVFATASDCRSRIELPTFDSLSPLLGQHELQRTLIDVQWNNLSMICNNAGSCHGLPSNQSVVPQLIPLEIQEGTQLKFHVSLPGQWSIYRVSEEYFAACNASNGTAIPADALLNALQLNKQWLTTGNNYFIVQSGHPRWNCQNGFRLNVTVKTNRCQRTEDDLLCSGYGVCFTSRQQLDFSCHCCDHYVGDRCQEFDACSSYPCARVGQTCQDAVEGLLGRNYTCICRQPELCDTRGDRTEIIVPSSEEDCEHSPCLNNGSCVSKEDDIVCLCPGPFWGKYCQNHLENTDFCFENPCEHGVCLARPDQELGYECLCLPGYYGEFCEYEYNECQSSPCPVNSVCVDEVARYECNCLPGYAGPTCSMDVNECESQPCLNGGTCDNQLNGFECECTSAYMGDLCEYLIEEFPHIALHQYKTSRQTTAESRNLFVGLSTFFSALVLCIVFLTVCYCRINRIPERVIKFSRPKWIALKKRLLSKGLSRQPLLRFSTSRIHPDAIFEANCHHYGDFPLNAPIQDRICSERV